MKNWNSCLNNNFDFIDFYLNKTQISKIIKIFLGFCLFLLSGNDTFNLNLILLWFSGCLSMIISNFLFDCLLLKKNLGGIHTFFDKFQRKLVEKLIANLTRSFDCRRNSFLVLFIFGLDDFFNNNLLLMFLRRFLRDRLLLIWQIILFCW